MKRYTNLFFTTATILNWYPLLRDDYNKEIVIDAFRFAVQQKRARIWAFVIMDTHIHLIWEILDPFTLAGVRRDMLKYISQTIKNSLVAKGETHIWEKFIVNKKDRYIQIWKKRPLSVEILYESVLQQKLDYIHRNLYRKGMNDVAYKYSSACFYATGIRNWDFL
jgi:REP element-mobilizing transposase RayT